MAQIGTLSDPLGPEDLSPEEEKLLAALLLEPHVRAAAKKAKISSRTAYRYLERRAFQEAHRKARREVVWSAVTTVQAAAGEAVETLRDIMKDPLSPVPSRVTAAKAVLETAFKAVELEDVIERLDRLEGEMEASKRNTG
jgi:hypothetical protein